MPKKRDEGHEETEQVLKELEARITKEYKKAENDLQAKLDDYMRRFKIKDDIKRNAVADGNLDQKEYQQWLIGQIAMGKRWEEMRDTIAEDLTHAAQIAKALAVDQMPDVYAINHNYGTFQVEKSSLVDTSYTLYDRDAAARMFKDTDFYKKPGRKVQKAINEGKQKAWDKKQIQSVMFQGIAQGESVGAIATRICKSTCDSDRKAAIRNARTMTTGIQNAGRVDSYKRAEDMGINLKQQWIATLDGRTRHEHRQLDGMMVDVGGVFTVDGYDIEYPGDPSAAPEMVYNCRCTLIPALEGFDRDMSLRHDDHLEDMSYDEWKESHDSYSDPITKQDDIAAAMKGSYIKEYRELSDNGVLVDKMASTEEDNDWVGADPSEVSKEDKRELMEYAGENGVNIVDLSRFDGDKELLMAQIDTVAKYMEMLPVKKTVTMTVDKLSDGDFGETRNRTIVLSQKAMRNRVVTEKNLAIPEGMFASKKAEDIAAHEYAHVYCKINAINGLDVAEKVYYNIYGRSPSRAELDAYLSENISEYAIVQKGKEIASEVLAKDNSQRTEFTEEYINELRRRSK